MSRRARSSVYRRGAFTISPRSDAEGLPPTFVHLHLRGGAGARPPPPAAAPPPRAPRAQRGGASPPDRRPLPAARIGSDHLAVADERAGVGGLVGYRPPAPQGARPGGRR